MHNADFDECKHQDADLKMHLMCPIFIKHSIELQFQ